MTYRERRERRAERLRRWADKRQTDAAATLARDEHYRNDHAFTFQPGHIPERARVIARADRAFASMRKADQMAARAASIDSQVSAAIYSDDHDAIEQLTARIARLESERDRKKAINREIRKGDGWSARITPPLTTDERTDLTTLAQVGQFRNGFPAYVFQNLSGNITRQRQRLARLQADAAQRARVAAVLAAERTQE